MTSSFSIQTAANSFDLPWEERLRKSPSGRRRPRPPNCVSTYRYATNSFVGDLLANSTTKITMLQKTHKENYSKSPAAGETFLVKDSHNPFVLVRNVSDKMLQENDEDNFYNAIRMNYSSSLKRKIKLHRPLSRNQYNRHPSTSKELLTKFYGRQSHVPKEETINNITVLSDHLCFDDGDDKVYNYSMRSSSLLASSIHPLLRPSLLHFRKNKRPLSKGRNCHRRGSTTSCSTLSSFESFSSFTHKSSVDDNDHHEKRSSSILGSSLRILMQTNHHQQVAPTSVSSAKQNSMELIFDTAIFNIQEQFRDMDIAGNTGVQVDATTRNMKPPAVKNKKKMNNREPTKAIAKTVEKAKTDYNRSEASLDFCLLEKPKTTRPKRFDQDDTPLSIFQPSVSSTQAESSSGIVFLFDSNVPA